MAVTSVGEILDTLRSLYLAKEDTAINSYATWTGNQWLFNDAIWEAEDSDFEVMKRARYLVGLEPLNYMGANPPRNLRG